MGYWFFCIFRYSKKNWLPSLWGKIALRHRKKKVYSQEFWFILSGLNIWLSILKIKILHHRLHIKNGSILQDMTIHLPFFFLAILIWSHGLVDLTGERKRKMYRLQQHRSVWIFPLTDSMPLKMAFSTLLELKPCCLTHCYSLNHIIAFNIDWSWNIFSLHNFCSMLIEQLLDHRKVRTVNLKFSQKIFIDSFYWNLKLAFKHCFSFATFLAAKLVAIDSEL